MKDPVVAGHPIHSIMTDVPIGATVGVVLFDAIGLFTHPANWHFAAHAATGLALFGGIVAALVGLWDYQSVPRDHPVRGVGATHGIANTGGLVLLVASFLLRFTGGGAPFVIAQIASLLALGVFGFTGYLGGDMVYKLGWRVRPAEYDEQLEADLQQSGEKARIAKAHQTIDAYEREHTFLPKA